MGNADLTQLETGGLRWLVDPSFVGDLRHVVARNLGDLARAGAKRIKHSTTRSTWRLQLGGSAVFIKHHRPRSLFERLKYLVLRSRAAAEWSISRSFAELGLPVAEPLAFGERRLGGVLAEAVLVSAEIPNARPLGASLRDGGSHPPTGPVDQAPKTGTRRCRAKRDLLRCVARLLRQTHDAGALHQDLHSGNILVTDVGDPFYIDLHRARVGAAVSRRERAANIAWLLAFLRDALTAGDRLCFIRAYLADPTIAALRPGGRLRATALSRTELRSFRRAVERRIVPLRERRYASRTKRCVKRSTGFRTERSVGLFIRRRTEFPAEAVLEAIEQHRELVAAGDADRVLKSDHRARVTIVEARKADVIPAMSGAPVAPPGRSALHPLRSAPPRLCVKEFLRPRLFHRLADAFTGSKALRAWVGANALAVRGIGTPRALAMVEAGGRSYFITEFVEGAVRFNDYVADHGRPEPGEATRRWHAFTRRAAEFIRRLHAARLRHRDLSAKNLLVRETADGDWTFYLVDVSDVRTGRAPTLRQRIDNLGQLDQIYVMPSRTSRLRFFRRYARGLRELRRPGFLARIDRISRARHQNWLDNGGGRAILEWRRQAGKPV
jgi:tRNA A-37 threonylcarbamoyl transferase component Bud32